VSGQKYRVCFFFDHGAGGCLWADNEITRQTFGLGPVDYAIARKMNKPDAATLQLIDSLDIWHARYYKHPLPFGTTFQQAGFHGFNKALDTLLSLLQEQLQHEFDIIDGQERYGENEMAEEYQEMEKSRMPETRKQARR